MVPLPGSDDDGWSPEVQFGGADEAGNHNARDPSTQPAEPEDDSCDDEWNPTSQLEAVDDDDDDDDDWNPSAQLDADNDVGGRCQSRTSSACRVHASIEPQRVAGTEHAQPGPQEQASHEDEHRRQDNEEASTFTMNSASGNHGWSSSRAGAPPRSWTAARRRNPLQDDSSNRDDANESLGQASVKRGAGIQDALRDAIKTAEVLEDTGNRLFQEGSFYDAYKAYRRGVSGFDACAAESLSEEARSLNVTLCCNAAQALLRCTAPDGASTSLACSMANRALALDPTNVKALFQKGSAHANANDWRSAQDNFKKALRLDPRNHEVWRELQKVREMLASEVPPSHTEAYATQAEAVAAAEEDKARGTRLFQEGRFHEASEAFRHGADLLEDIELDLTAETCKLKAALCNNGAQALLRCPEIEWASTDQAAWMAERALALEPTNVKALFRRGTAYANGQEWYLARKDFEKVLELEPSNEPARRELRKIDARCEAAETVSGFAPPRRGQEPPLQSLDAGALVKKVMREAERFREEILEMAQKRNAHMEWCQRLNHLQIEASDWAKHVLTDAEMVQDIALIRGPVFTDMSHEQKEDFVTACEFVSETRNRHGAEIEELMQPF